MLLVHLSVSPTEGIEQFEGPNGYLSGLQIVEDSLQVEGYRLEVVDVSGHLVHSSSESSDKEHTLEE
jgi:hypothetical protein